MKAMLSLHRTQTAGWSRAGASPCVAPPCACISIWCWPPTNTACSRGSHTGLCLCCSTYNGATELPDGSQETLYVPHCVHLPDSPATGRNNAMPEAELCLSQLLEAVPVGGQAGQCVL